MKLEDQKQIEAPPTVVWSVTEDVERWPAWNEVFQAVQRLDDGPFEVGSVTRIKQPGLPETQWRVTALTSGESFTWEARANGIHMIATHELSTVGTGTSSILRIEMSGIVAVFLWPLLRSSVRKSLQREHACLKVKCEALAASA
jgi:hypothetical protein